MILMGSFYFLTNTSIKKSNHVLMVPMMYMCVVMNIPVTAAATSYLCDSVTQQLLLRDCDVSGLVSIWGIKQWQQTNNLGLWS